MKRHHTILLAGAALMAGAAILANAAEQDTKRALTQELWPRPRIEAALQAIDRQRTAGLISDQAHQKRSDMLLKRLAGTYESQTLSVTNPPLNFIQNGSFEHINRNSARNRSRWLWWNGWSWGGDYENDWEDRPKYVHEGKYSARIRCTGTTGRIGIFTPKLPAPQGVQEYRLTFWARGEGDNRLFVNFESGARGTLRATILTEWKQYTLAGTPEPGADTYSVYLYVIGGGTIWLDDVRLVPVGGRLD